MTTRFPCRSVLVMLIVMGLFAAASLTAGMAAGFAGGIEHGFAAGAANGVVFHSRIDLATGALAAGDAVGVDFHSRIDWAGGVVPTGSPATTESNVVATSTSITRRASIPVLNIARPSMRFL
jgi:hypothetical protein